jgi:hypothetical protein
LCYRIVGTLEAACEAKKKERWQELCAPAALERDPVKMIKHVREMNDLLAEKEERLIESRLLPNPETTV